MEFPRITWFSPDDSPAERRLLFKLDLLIVPYAFLAYWTKYIDQANISEFHPLSTSILSIPIGAITLTMTLVNRQCLRLWNGTIP